MHYCAYSFADLFQAANGRRSTEKEDQRFLELSQTQRNQSVQQLAAKAGWSTQLVETSAGEFLAFWPKG